MLSQHSQLSTLRWRSSGFMAPTTVRISRRLKSPDRVRARSGVTANPDDRGSLAAPNLSRCFAHLLLLLPHHSMADKILLYSFRAIHGNPHHESSSISYRCRPRLPLEKQSTARVELLEARKPATSGEAGPGPSWPPPSPRIHSQGSRSRPAASHVDEKPDYGIEDWCGATCVVSKIGLESAS